jgi:SRSO17 transposase
MVSGLLMELDDHNCWTIAEAAGHRGPNRLQHFLSRAVWDEQLVADIASAWAVSHLDDGDGVLIVDETADKKSSGTAAGAARQYSGTVGGIALCQSSARRFAEAHRRDPGDARPQARRRRRSQRKTAIATMPSVR